MTVPYPSSSQARGKNFVLIQTEQRASPSAFLLRGRGRDSSHLLQRERGDKRAFSARGTRESLLAREREDKITLSYPSSSQAMERTLNSSGQSREPCPLPFSPRGRRRDSSPFLERERTRERCPCCVFSWRWREHLFPSLLFARGKG